MVPIPLFIDFTKQPKVFRNIYLQYDSLLKLIISQEFFSPIIFERSKISESSHGEGLILPPKQSNRRNKSKIIDQGMNHKVELLG